MQGQQVCCNFLLLTAYMCCCVLLCMCTLCSYGRPTQDDSIQVVIGDRAHILLLLSNISLADVSPISSNGSAASPVLVGSAMSWLGASPTQQAEARGGNPSSNSTDGNSTVFLGFGFQRDVVVVPAAAPRETLQLRQLVLHELPQGPGVASVAVANGKRLPKELLTVLLWSITR
jgi:hypothetical protein